MTDADFQDRLRRDLVRAAEVMEPERSAPPLSSRYFQPEPVRERRPSRHRFGYAVAFGLVTILIVAMVRTRPDRPRASAAPPLQAVDLPRLLPPTEVTVEDAAETPPRVPAAGSSVTYAQAFQGDDDTNPQRLVVATVNAPPNALEQYQQGTNQAERVRVGSHEAYLMAFDRHLQMLWQEPDGLVVSLEVSELTRADLQRLADGLSRRAAPAQGVDLATTLSLRQLEEGPYRGNGAEVMLTFRRDKCRGYLQIFHNGAADQEAVGMLADSSQMLTIDGHRGTSVTFPGSGDLAALIWIERPGVTVRLQGQGCDLLALARSVREVDRSTWVRAVPRGLRTQDTGFDQPRSLGTTFGLAH